MGMQLAGAKLTFEDFDQEKEPRDNSYNPWTYTVLVMPVLGNQCADQNCRMRGLDD